MADHKTADALRHVLTFASFTPDEVHDLLKLSQDIKANPDKYSESMARKTLLMFFNKPSLRTRLSFETGMTQMGGHAIYYHLQGQPLGVKENFSDTAKVVSRYVDVIMARVASRREIAGLSDDSNVPVINGLDDWGHPCQILSDLLTIVEHRGANALAADAPKPLRMTYIGDQRNNVTYDLMRAACMLKFHITVCGPKHADFSLEKGIEEECRELSKKYGGSFGVEHDPVKAMTSADVVYTDSWMSYGISLDLKEHRLSLLEPYRVTADLWKHTAPNALFLHCLPALRGMEVTADVIDGPQSKVFDEAENRLHAQKALILWLLYRNKIPTK